jgi:hypothetical protein
MLLAGLSAPDLGEELKLRRHTTERASPTRRGVRFATVTLQGDPDCKPDMYSDPCVHSQHKSLQLHVAGVERAAHLPGSLELVAAHAVDLDNGAALIQVHARLGACPHSTGVKRQPPRGDQPRRTTAQRERNKEGRASTQRAAPDRLC